MARGRGGHHHHGKKDDWCFKAACQAAACEQQHQQVYGGHPLQQQYPELNYTTQQVYNTAEYYQLTQAQGYQERVEGAEGGARFLEGVNRLAEAYLKNHGG